MIGILRLLMIVGGIAGSIFYFLKKGLNQASWRKGISEYDYNQLKVLLNNKANELVDLNKEELKLLSLNADLSTVKRNGKKYKTGMFKSIYDENLMEFIQLDYEGSRALIMSNTFSQEFVFNVTESSTHIYQNGTLLGYLFSNGELKDPINKKVLINIDPSKNKKYQSISDGEFELANILNPLMPYTSNERVFNMLDAKSEFQKMQTLALTFLNMIQRV